MTPRKPVRVMKVRWPRRLACGHYVLTGQVIIGRGHRWICRPCALAEIKTTRLAHPGGQQ